jgi:hypothetical protein
VTLQRFQRTQLLQPVPLQTGRAQQTEALAQALGEFQQIATQIGQTVQADRGQEAGATEGATLDAPQRRSPISAFGRAFNETATRAHAAAVDTDIRVTMDRLSQEHPTDTAAFDASADGYAKGLLDQVDPRIRPQIEQELALQRIRHRNQILREEQALILEQSMTELVSSAEGIQADALRAARDGDVEFMEHQRGKWLEMVQSATRSEDNPEGLLAPGDVAQMERQFERAIDTELVIGDFETILRDMGPDAAQQAFDQFERSPLAELGPLTNEDRDRILARMGALMGRDMTRLNREEAARRAAEQAGLQAIRERVGQAKSVLDRGFIPEGLEQLVKDTEGTSFEGEVQVAVSLANQASEFSLLPAVARSNVLERLEAGMRGREVNPIEVERLRTFDTMHQNLLRAQDRDPMGLAITQGIIEAPEPIDMSSAEALAESLRGRVGAAQRIESHLQIADAPPLTQAEADQLAEMWAASTAETRVQLLGGLSAGLGERSRDAFQQIHKSGADLMAWTGGMVTEGMDLAARQVLLGLDELTADPKLAPPDLDIRPELETLRRAYPPATGAAVIEAVTAHYAHQSRLAGDFSAVYERGRARKAIEAVTGGLLEFNLRSFGPKSHSPAPAPGVTNRDMRNWFSSLGPSDIETMGGVAGMAPETALDTIRRSGRLTSIGRGEWLVSLSSPTDDGRERYLQDEQGNPFVLRWSTSQQRVDEGAGLREAPASGRIAPR